MRKIFAFICIFFLVFTTILGQKNTGVSKSIGSVSDGSLENGYKLPKSGPNFKFFSSLDYHILRRCYIHSDIYKIVLETYKSLEEIYPDYTFYIMEASRKEGGKPFPHRTHQNGTSIDFMTPLLKEGIPYTGFDNWGLWRYLLDFDENGNAGLNDKVSIDFEKTAQHIIMLDKVSSKYGYRIKKVILETNLKDEIFSTKYGNELKQRNIYFVKNLPKKIDQLHDDHYHIDFEKK